MQKLELLAFVMGVEGQVLLSLKGSEEIPQMEYMLASELG